MYYVHVYTTCTSKKWKLVSLFIKEDYYVCLVGSRLEALLEVKSEVLSAGSEE